MLQKEITQFLKGYRNKMARTTVPNELVAINAIQGTLIADNAITAVHIATDAMKDTSERTVKAKIERLNNTKEVE
jgi:hypothetical protein